MCTTAQNHENIHILFIYPSIGRLIKKNLMCPVQRTKTGVSYSTNFTLQFIFYSFKITTYKNYATKKYYNQGPVNERARAHGPLPGLQRRGPGSPSALMLICYTLSGPGKKVKEIPISSQSWKLLNHQKGFPVIPSHVNSPFNQGSYFKLIPIFEGWPSKYRRLVLKGLNHSWGYCTHFGGGSREKMSVHCARLFLCPPGWMV